MTSPYESGVVGVYALTTYPKVSPLLGGFKWGSHGYGTSAAITYSFPTYGSLWHSDYSTYLSNEPFNNFQPFTVAQQNAARQALAAWAEVANITFTEVDDLAGDNDVGDIRFANSGAVTDDPTAAAWAYMPFEDYSPNWDYPENGDVWFDITHKPNLKLEPGQFGFSSLVHEIGHAIGLDHPFAEVPGEPALPAVEDNQRYSIMSYTPDNGANIRPYGPMMYDILAIQYIYGANMTTRAGDDVYTFSASKEYLEVIWDAGGHDTIDVSSQTGPLVIDLRAGQFSILRESGTIGIAYHVTIEDAIGGTGNDYFRGNEVGNYLQGGAGGDSMEGRGGDDTLSGGTGIDWLWGGDGNDTYRVNHKWDTVVERVNDGLDTILSTASYSLTYISNVEILKLVGASNINATGSWQAETLVGNSGSNILDGAGDADTLRGGGAGNDTYIVDDAGVTVDEETNTDLGDEVRSSTLLLAAIAGIENYTYAGKQAWTFVGTAADNEIIGGSANDSRDGGDGNDTLLGNGGSDILVGGTGNDWLDGGAGNDQMKGGAGNDTYVLNAVGDSIDEEGNLDGEDRVRNNVSVNLATLAGGAIEHAVLLGTSSIDATGNAAHNELTGNSAANRLKGSAGNDTLLGNGGNDILIGGNGNDWLNGGAGNDQMKGGAGNDIYVLDSIGDSIDEEGNADSDDIVRTLISVNLATLAGGAIEHAVLLGAGSIKAIGNGEDNRLTGNDGANLLDGGKGADTMIGGKGADIYVVEDSHDQVIEMAGGGIDLVRSTRTYVLEANVENATLIGKSDIDAFGNDLNNVLIGNDGGNELVGFGGADTMVGGKGNDTYIVDNAGDVVIESIANSKGGGFDSVISVVTFSLATHANIEDLYLGDLLNINGTGNALDNRIMGGSGNNRLIGGGGNDLLFGSAGADTLTGGLGSDVFWYSSLTDGGGDRITDFQKGNGGDVLSLGDLMHYIIGIGSTAGVFADGYLSFQSSGANTRVLIDADGGMDNPFTLVTLANVTLTQADTANYTI